MKTKEFMKRVEDDLGYVAHKDEIYISITNKYYEPFAIVDLRKTFGIDTNFVAFGRLDEYDRNSLFNSIQEYARTPLEEREEEKKYYVKLKNEVLAYNMRGSYLNFSKGNEHYLFSNQELTRYYTSIFTQKEINEFPDEVKEVLPLCEKIEIKETDQ